MEKHNNNKQPWPMLQALWPIFVSVGLIVYSWFSFESRVSQLEFRLQTDEQVIQADITDLQDRIRVIEIDTPTRLSRIDTKLETMENYIMQTNEIIRKIWEYGPGKQGVGGMGSDLTSRTVGQAKLTLPWNWAPGRMPE